MLIKLETKRKKKNQALIVPAGYFVLEEQSMFVKWLFHNTVIIERKYG